MATVVNQYEKITQSILTAIAGELPAWRREWRTLKAQGLSTIPVNAVTGRAYRGINACILWALQDADMRYLTYKQAQQLGGNVRRGEKGTQIVFWKKSKYTTRDAKTGENEERSSLLIRFYTVFNVSQCENLKLPKPAKAPESKPVPETLQSVYAAHNAIIEHGGDVACYIPSIDRVRMPRPEAFTSEDAYAATGLHEMAHWTGHDSRLKRDLSGRFGSKMYAAEELVAELTAAFLCATLGINSSLENHASYLKSWNELLREDSRAIITAASKAQQAADYILAKLGDQTADQDDDGDDDSPALAMAA